MSIVLSQFARQRLFGSDPRVTGVTAEGFEAELNQREPEAVLDGYAPFCKLHVHRNWTDTPVSAIRITPENESHLRSAYEARTDEELPVLTRWFEGLKPDHAGYLIVILYSREQMAREGEELAADWGVVGLLATDTPEEIPDGADHDDAQCARRRRRRIGSRDRSRCLRQVRRLLEHARQLALTPKMESR